MSKISLRISKELRNALKKRAANSDMNLSEYIRKVLANTSAYHDQNWLLIAWRLFGVNMVKLRKALSRSLSVADFLAEIDIASSSVTIIPNVSDNLDFDFIIEGKTYNVALEPSGSISQDVEKIIKRLDEKVLENFMEGI